VALRRRGTREVLEAAQRLCDDADPDARALGADILGQLGIPRRTFPDECAAVLVRMLEHDSDPNVLQSVAIALGHLRDPRAIEPLLRQRRHENAVVRYGVVYGLHGHEDERAIAALIELSGDEDDDVRDWATFALGSRIRVDSVAIRQALLARVDDPHADTRGEALLGLARRGDERVLEPLIRELAAERVGGRPVQAALELRDWRLRASLVRLRGRWGGDDALLDEAIRHCSIPDNAAPSP
jgi:HEAT repeat protein